MAGGIVERPGVWVAVGVGVLRATQVQVGAEPGLVEPDVDGADLAAQGGELRGQGGQALAESARRGFSGQGPGHEFPPSMSAYR